MTRDAKDRHSWRAIPGKVLDEARRRAGFGAARPSQDAPTRNLRSPSAKRSSVWRIPIKSVPGVPNVAENKFEGGSTLPWNPSGPSDPSDTSLPLLQSNTTAHAEAPTARQAREHVWPIVTGSPPLGVQHSPPSVREALATIDAAAAQRSARLHGGPSRLAELDATDAAPLQPLAAAERGMDAAPRLVLRLDRSAERLRPPPLPRAQPDCINTVDDNSEDLVAQESPEASSGGTPLLLVLSTLLIAGLGIAYLADAERASIASGVLVPNAQRTSDAVAARLTPESHVWSALVFAPAKDAALLHEGLAAGVVLAALPVSKLGARVTRVAKRVASADEVMHTLGRALEEPVMRVELELLPSEQLTRVADELRSGEPLAARIRTRERRVTAFMSDFLRELQVLTQ